MISLYIGVIVHSWGDLPSVKFPLPSSSNAATSYPTKRNSWNELILQCIYHMKKYTAKWKKVALVIGYWAFGHMEQCNDLLEWLPNNSLHPMPNSWCSKQPVLNQLYVKNSIFVSRWSWHKLLIQSINFALMSLCLHFKNPMKSYATKEDTQCNKKYAHLHTNAKV